jgi:L-ascorbate metabolism protein UlaG (beta-lactamase superfamily)
MQLSGKRILVDPVLSGLASPISFFGKAYEGSNPYAASDLPEIDYLFITHDHWDHLDYETMLQLKPKIKRVFCGLGTGAHLERWGFNPEIITEKDWNESEDLNNGFIIHTTTSRHFSGRGLSRNKALWLSFVLQTPVKTIFIGGDGGYDTHFKDIGEEFGPFDLVILENGQYNKKWKSIHMFPEQVLQAALDLKARQLFPVHSGKFTLAEHPWNEPLSEITRLNKSEDLLLATPMIGESVILSDSLQTFTKWWEGVD